MTTFTLDSLNARATMVRCWKEVERIVALGKRVSVKVDEAKSRRTIDQNAKMWALLGDISAQVAWVVDGDTVRLDPHDWKQILTAALKKHQRVAKGVDGGLVFLGTHTSHMNTDEMSELIEMILWFGAEHSVNWSGDV